MIKSDSYWLLKNFATGANFDASEAIRIHHPDIAMFNHSDTNNSRHFSLVKNTKTKFAIRYIPLHFGGNFDHFIIKSMKYDKK